MNNLESLVVKATNVQQFAEGYFDYIAQLLKQIDTGKIGEFISELETARDNHSTVFFIGNGGSAATASHMVNDLGFGSRTHVDPPFRVLSLADNVAAITAVANDTGYDNVFLRQLQMYYKPGDKLVAISASGNSPNLLQAASWVKEQSGKVISLLGFDGGKLDKISDVSIIVKTPKGEYGPVEDVHMILDHLIYTWIWHEKRRGQI